MTFEANDIGINAAYCANSSFEAIGSQGHDLSPSGTSQIGVLVGNSQNCTFSALGMGGSYLGASFRVLGAASNILFDACLAGNAYLGGITWDIQSSNSIMQLACMSLQ